LKKRFNYLLVVMLVIVLFSAVAVTGAQDNSLQKIKDKGYFILGLDDSFPPMGFRGENGEIVGFDIDMAREVAKRMGVEVELKPVEWDGILFSLKNGNIDVIWNGLTITGERAKEIAFSRPYLKNRQIIIISGKPIESKTDLEGKIVGVQMGSSSVTALNSEPEVANKLSEVRKYSNNMEALMDLRTGRIDAVVVDEIVGRYYIRKDPESYQVLNDDFGRESYGVGIRKEDVAFKEELDRILDEMKTDGTADELAQKWFGDESILIK